VSQQYPIRLPAPHSIGGVQVHPIRLTELCAWMMQAVATQQRVAVMYTNAHAVNLAQHDPRFREALNSADVVFCDGQGVRLAAALLGCPLPARFTPPDWIHQLASLCAQRQYRLFLLGAKPGVAEHAARRLQDGFPDLQVTTHHGYFDAGGNEAVLGLINASGAHVLLVGMGMPLQEQWIRDNLPRLTVNVAMSVGALFDYLGGGVTRGPRWLTDHGFEWLCRLWFEPRRLWRRYLVGNPAFVWLVLRQWLRHTTC